MRRSNGGPVISQRVPGGVAHEMPADLRMALIANATALTAWQALTPLARNEFICWVLDAKQHPTRERRIRRTQAVPLGGPPRSSGGGTACTCEYGVRLARGPNPPRPFAAVADYRGTMRTGSPYPVISTAAGEPSAAGNACYPGLPSTWV